LYQKKSTCNTLQVSTILSHTPSQAYHYNSNAGNEYMDKLAHLN